MKARPEEDSGERWAEDSHGSQEQESWLRKAARTPSIKPPVLPRAGQIISRKYLIEEELGRGGMGAVFRAQHVVSHKRVALKWMLKPSVDGAERRQRREARATARVSHPNVVDIYDIGEEGDAAYLVMELLEGESLRTRLKRGPMGVSEAVDLLLPAMRGLAAAHQQGVVHRDLKPDNIFLCIASEFEPPDAKVLDFGVSTISAPDYQTQTGLTKEGTVLGTPAYMSPEQLRDPSNLDARADVYAMGVVLYEATAGRLPFESASYNALVLAIAGDAPPPPSSFRSGLPPHFEEHVLRAIEKDRDKRFADMEGMIEALMPFGSEPAPPPRQLSLSEFDRTMRQSERLSNGGAPGKIKGAIESLMPFGRAPAPAPRPLSSGEFDRTTWQSELPAKGAAWGRRIAVAAALASLLGYWLIQRPLQEGAAAPETEIAPAKAPAQTPLAPQQRAPQPSADPLAPSLPNSPPPPRGTSGPSAQPRAVSRPSSRPPPQGTSGPSAKPARASRPGSPPPPQGAGGPPAKAATASRPAVASQGESPREAPAPYKPEMVPAVTAHNPEAVAKRPAPTPPSVDRVPVQPTQTGAAPPRPDGTQAPADAPPTEGPSPAPLKMSLEEF